MLGGLQAPDTGDVCIAGRKLPAGDVRAARAAGLAMVHQHFSLPPSFTVAEALELTAARPGGRPVYRRAELHGRWRDDAAEIGGEAVLSTRIRDLPVETRQSLEIVRALAAEARILMLDEPTALLTPAAIDTLFERLRRLRDDGVTVLIVLHKLREVAAVADAVSVLRDGELVLGPSEMSEVSQGRLSDAIVGPAPGTNRSVGPDATSDAELRLGPPSPPGQLRTGSQTAPLGGKTLPIQNQQPGQLRTLLELAGVSSRESAFEPGLHGIDLSVGTRRDRGHRRRGGQRAAKPRVGGGRAERRHRRLRASRRRRRHPGSPGQQTDAGAAARALRPQQRGNQPQRAPVVEPIGAAPHRTPSADDWPLVSLRRHKRQATEAMDHWRVRYGSVAQPADSLSGGNVQRLILSRELASGLEVLVAAQPTRGLDFAATDFVRRSLHGLRDAGAGVLLVSSDLDELFELSNRLVVMYGGHIAARFEAPYDRRAVGDAMTGTRR